MKTAHFLRIPITTSQDLTSAALSYTTSINRHFKVEEVILHASVAITETFTITRDSGNGANYDHVLFKRVMSSEQDVIFRPQGECNFFKGDELKIQCTNANTTGIVYITIKLSEM